MEEQKLCCCFILVIISLVSQINCECKVPKHFWGDFYSIERGDNLDSLINELGIKTKYLADTAVCDDFLVDNSTIDANGRFDAKILFFASDSNCYYCYEMLYRTPNILQYKQSSCRSASNGRTPSLQDVCSEILPQTELLTMFKKTMDTVNCKQSFEGVYQFHYEEQEGGGGICDSDQSVVVACQEPGSPYVDNQVFNMNFGKCPDVTSSENKKIRFQCMGTWRDHLGNIYSAIADLGEEIHRERFRCMLTRADQQRSDNRKRFTMTRYAECSSLQSPYDGPIRLNLLPVIYGTQLVQPTCNLPRNFTGTWFTTGEFDTDVVINSTHIYFKTRIEQFTYKETYFTCQQYRDSRFLMTAVTVGKCEIDYVCFDFMPRHHNIVRWRMGKPYRMTVNEMSQPDYLERKFRQACTWSSFTIDRNNIDWTYQTFVLNPPAPIDCPIGGRYSFKQVGAVEEQYNTRIRGITERPRHQIDCRRYESVFKSCYNNPKKIFIDAEYCATLDHTGRPIGEYDEPDRELNCVGFWMEDMKSYLITYDEEDAVSQFRCWVFQRLDWRDLIVSRANRAQCSPFQTANSYLPSEGASLHLELKENERLFDECPQRFDTGVDPYQKEGKIYVVGELQEGAASHLVAGSVAILISSLITLILSL